jgi:hypothetical protein
MSTIDTTSNAQFLLGGFGQGMNLAQFAAQQRLAQQDRQRQYQQDQLNAQQQEIDNARQAQQLQLGLNADKRATDAFALDGQQRSSMASLMAPSIPMDGMSGPSMEGPWSNQAQDEFQQKRTAMREHLATLDPAQQIQFSNHIRQLAEEAKTTKLGQTATALLDQYNLDNDQRINDPELRNMLGFLRMVKEFDPGSAMVQANTLMSSALKLKEQRDRQGQLANQLANGNIEELQALLNLPVDELERLYAMQYAQQRGIQRGGQMSPQQAILNDPVAFQQAVQNAMRLNPRLTPEQAAAYVQNRLVGLTSQAESNLTGQQRSGNTGEVNALKTQLDVLTKRLDRVMSATIPDPAKVKQLESMIEEVSNELQAAYRGNSSGMPNSSPVDQADAQDQQQIDVDALAAQVQADMPDASEDEQLAELKRRLGAAQN